MPSSASYSESRSSRGPNRKQWLPLLVLAVLTSLSIASTVGLSLSIVTFSRTDELRKPGHGVAQSFVLFASMLSLLYTPLHLLAARKGATLYFAPPIPAFRHQLHAWSTLTIRLAAAMWASATVAVAVGIYRGGGGHNTVHLNVDLFACTTGFLSACVILCVVQLATRPFDLPWLSPPHITDEVVACGGGEFDDKNSGTITRGSSTSESSTDRTIGGSPVHPPRLKTAAVSGKTSRSTSSSDRCRRTRNMARTRRYILDAPIPVAPLKRRGSGGTGGTTGPPARSGGKGDPGVFERGLVPSASESESFFAAAAVSTAVNTPDSRRGKGGGERAATPETVVYVGLPRVPASAKVAAGGSGSDCGNRGESGVGGRRAVAGGPLGPRDMRRVGGREGRQGGGGVWCGLGASNGGGFRMRVTGLTLPAPPPLPVKAYPVPGAWMPRSSSDGGVGGFF